MIARGGALLLIKRNLNPFIHPKGEAKAELVWCTVHPNPKTEILVSVVYRPERGGEHNLEAICNSISCIETDNIELSQIERGRILGRGAVKCNCSRHTSRGSQRIEGFCPGGGHSPLGLLRIRVQKKRRKESHAFQAFWRCGKRVSFSPPFITIDT